VRSTAKAERSSEARKFRVERHGKKFPFSSMFRGKALRGFEEESNQDLDLGDDWPLCGFGKTQK
jgi:hypothetical protein